MSGAPASEAGGTEDAPWRRVWLSAKWEMRPYIYNIRSGTGGRNVHVGCIDFRFGTLEYVADATLVMVPALVGLPAPKTGSPWDAAPAAKGKFLRAGRGG